MTVDLNTIEALTFDVGGTIFDWHHTICEEVERLAQVRGVEISCTDFANNWRWRMFELLGQVRSGELPWMNADALHRRALDDMVAKYPALDLTTAERDEVNHQGRASLPIVNFTPSHSTRLKIAPSPLWQTTLHPKRLPSPQIDSAA